MNVLAATTQLGTIRIVGERGDKERELAREARQHAVELLELIERDGPDADERRRRWTAAEEAALLHTRLADVYDREDEVADGL